MVSLDYKVKMNQNNTFVKDKKESTNPVKEKQPTKSLCGKASLMSSPTSTDMALFWRDRTLIVKTLFKHKHKVTSTISSQRIPNSGFV